MKFDFYIKNAKGKSGWGFAIPRYIGSMLYKQHLRYSTTFEGSSFDVNWTRSNPINISYRIGVSVLSKASERPSTVGHSNTGLGISAEGVHDSNLCMIGCRNTGAKNQISVPASMDCEIFLNLHLPLLYQKRNEGYVTGSIKSLGDVSDPLYFESMEVSYEGQAKLCLKKNGSRELVVAFNTLACVFVLLQLHHVRKWPEVIPLNSLVLRSLLILVYMIPPVLNLEALFSQTHNQDAVLLRGGRWFHGNKVLLRVATMIAFLLHFRLLQVSWSPRLNNQCRQDL